MLDRAVELTRHYVLERHQFGQAAGDLPGRAVPADRGRSRARRSGRAGEVHACGASSPVDAGPAATRWLCGAPPPSGRRIVFRVAHQLHGAIGFCDETALSWVSRASVPLRRLPLRYCRPPGPSSPDVWAATDCRARSTSHLPWRRHWRAGAERPVGPMAISPLWIWPSPPPTRHSATRCGPWLAEHLVGRLRRVGRRVGSSAKGDELELRKAWERELASGGWIGMGWPARLRWPRAPSDPADHLQRGVRQVRRTEPRSVSSARSCSDPP